MNDLFPEKSLWPSDPAARGLARAVSAEMHSSFFNLREVWPMQVLREGLQHVTSGGVAQDLARIDALWAQCRDQFGSDGDFLFGQFSIADAMYAPVVSRIITYGPVKMSDQATSYIQTIRSQPVMEKWIAGARQQA